jgi:hypothetical protein
MSRRKGAEVGGTEKLVVGPALGLIWGCWELFDAALPEFLTV